MTPLCPTSARQPRGARPERYSAEDADCEDPERGTSQSGDVECVAVGATRLPLGSVLGMTALVKMIPGGRQARARTPHRQLRLLLRDFLC